MPKFKNRTSNGCAGARTSEHLERDIIVVSVVVAVLVAVVQILIVVIARASRRIGYRGVVIQRSQLSKPGIQIISATLMDEWREVANC